MHGHLWSLMRAVWALAEGVIDPDGESAPDRSHGVGQRDGEGLAAPSRLGTSLEAWMGHARTSLEPHEGRMGPGRGGY